MNIKIREFTKEDIKAMVSIWNEVVNDAMAFPQIDTLDEETGSNFFASQTYTAVAYDAESSDILGLYILHPNNVGRCAHISNASFAVRSDCRGHRIGEKLVLHCLKTAKEKGFSILQFNAVVKTNEAANKLYKKLGFVKLGVIPGGFRLKNGKYEDIIVYYRLLNLQQDVP